MRSNFRLRTGLFVVLAALAACGGGGGDDAAVAAARGPIAAGAHVVRGHATRRRHFVDAIHARSPSCTCARNGVINTADNTTVVTVDSRCRHGRRGGGAHRHDDGHGRRRRSHVHEPRHQHRGNRLSTRASPPPTSLEPSPALPSTSPHHRDVRCSLRRSRLARRLRRSSPRSRWSTCAATVCSTPLTTPPS